MKLKMLLFSMLFLLFSVAGFSYSDTDLSKDLKTKTELVVLQKSDIFTDAIVDVKMKLPDKLDIKSNALRQNYIYNKKQKTFAFTDNKHIPIRDKLSVC